jgi:hypothetical protein
MSFFEEQPRDNTVELAKALNKYLRVKGTSSKSNLRMLFLLCKKHGREEVVKVMEWYRDHKQDDFVPQVNSITQFYAKYGNIVKAMMTQQEVAVEPVQEMDTRVFNMTSRLATELQYPPEILARLYTIAKLSDNRWKDFCVHTSATATCESRDQSFLNHILMLEAVLFVENWLRFLSQKFGKMEHYTAPWDRCIWRLDHVSFRESFWCKWSYDWCGDLYAFDALLNDLTKEQRDAS